MAAMAFTVRKIGAFIPMTREQLLMAGAVEPTEAERAEMEIATARAEEYARKLDAWTANLGVVGHMLDPVAHPVASAVLAIHHRDDTGYCPVCDEWPCQTADAVASALGLPSPTY